MATGATKASIVRLILAQRLQTRADRNGCGRLRFAFADAILIEPPVPGHGHRPAHLRFCMYVSGCGGNSRKIDSSHGAQAESIPSGRYARTESLRRRRHNPITGVVRLRDGRFDW